MPEERLYQGPIYVKKSPVHGYGVFAAADLAAGELIEECHTLFYSESLDPLSNYSFSWQNQSALPLGFACIYNHSDNPNIEFENDLARGLILFKTLRAIRTGEELCSSYGTHWFSSRKLKLTGGFRRCYRSSGLVLRAALIVTALLASLELLRALAP